MKITRRDAIKTSGLTLGGIAVAGNAALGDSAKVNAGNTTGAGLSEHNSLFQALEPCHPQRETLGPQEMRITFLGTWYCPRLSQEANSVFVELGNGDSFVFDCGTGVMTKYNALRIPLSRMDKIFLTHIHGDHVGDLTHIYTFGPAFDRKSPLYVWGPTNSGVLDPVTHQPYNDGVVAYCSQLREAVRWHTESMSFLSTAWANPKVPTWTKPDPGGNIDSYDLVPYELPWNVEGYLAYQSNGVSIYSFPAVHTRQGAISYKLAWEIGTDQQGKPITLSMIFTGDTKPNNYVIRQATGGVDVLIHEITTSPEMWTENFTGIPPTNEPAFSNAVAVAQRVMDSSHTPEKAFGYILSQLKNPPALAVGTHFPASDDTLREAFSEIRYWYGGPVTVALDLMVLNVTTAGVRQRRAVVSDFTWAALSPTVVYADPSEFATPKYHDKNGVGDPTAQLDPYADIIPPSVYDPG